MTPSALSFALGVCLVWYALARVIIGLLNFALHILAVGIFVSLLALFFGHA
jgi:hypothetical protein